MTQILLRAAARREARLNAAQEASIAATRRDPQKERYLQEAPMPERIVINIERPDVSITYEAASQEANSAITV